MKKIRFTTPENIEIEYTLANLGSRAAAAAVDFIILGIVTLILIGAVIVIMFKAPDFWKNYYGWIIAIVLILQMTISFGYFLLCELNSNGRTWGKKIFKLRAIRDNGEPLTVKHSLIRTLFKLLIDTMGIGVVMIFFTKENKRVGDYLASTVVVMDINLEAPVSLEDLRKADNNYMSILKADEKKLIEDYFQRRQNLPDRGAKIGGQIRQYLETRLKNDGIEVEAHKELLDSIFL